MQRYDLPPPDGAPLLKEDSDCVIPHRFIKDLVLPTLSKLRIGRIELKWARAQEVDGGGGAKKSCALIGARCDLESPYLLLCKAFLQQINAGSISIYSGRSTVPNPESPRKDLRSVWTPPLSLGLLQLESLTMLARRHPTNDNRRLPETKKHLPAG